MNSAARQAAEQIAALINSRVQSPRIDEMEAIIAGVTTRQHACAHTAQDDPALAALQQRLEAVTQQYRDAQHCDEATKRADDADRELGVVSRRIFDARPITLHNLKQRAVLARYWHQFAYDAEKWTVPEDCGSWEDEVIAQLIHGVLQIDAPPDQPIGRDGRIAVS